MNQRAEEIEAVTVADVQRVAQKYFTENRRTKVVIEPSLGEMLKSLVKGKDDEGAAPATKPAENRVADAAGSEGAGAAPGRFPRRSAAQPLLSEFPKVPREEKTLDNGLKVVVVPNSELPLVTMTLGLKFGAWTDDPEKPGAASMAAEMITQGTENYTSAALAQELEANAITLNGGVGMDNGHGQRELHEGPDRPRDEAAGRGRAPADVPAEGLQAIEGPDALAPERQHADAVVPRRARAAARGCTATTPTPAPSPASPATCARSRPTI